MTNATQIHDPNKSIKSLGDRLDVAERDWIAAHPHRSADEAIWNSEVGDAYDAYRKALGGHVPWDVSPPIEGATSLRDRLDKEARQVRECRSLQQNVEFHKRAAKRRQRERDRTARRPFRIRW